LGGNGAITVVSVVAAIRLACVVGILTTTVPPFGSGIVTNSAVVRVEVVVVLFFGYVVIVYVVIVCNCSSICLR
jgi:hypothetical protein